MNIASWFANFLIEMFGLSSEMAIGTAGLFGVFALMVLIFGASGVTMYMLVKTGVIKD